MKATITRRTLAMAGLFVLGIGVAAAGTARASDAGPSGSSTGWIRLAHLSPNTPAVDVYLYSFGDSKAMIVLHHVAYGTVSPYEQVAAGDYSVAMRAAGAAAGSPAVLSTSVDITAGHAYTVAGMGPESGLRLAVMDDRLTTPSGQSLVRVIEASLKQRVATVTFDGRTLASKLAFGSVSSYQAVAPGAGTVAVTEGTGHVTSAVSLKADTVHTLVVLDGTDGLETVDLLDAAGNTADPVGGVATGFGGTATHKSTAGSPPQGSAARGTSPQGGAANGSAARGSTANGSAAQGTATDRGVADGIGVGSAAAHGAGSPVPWLAAIVAGLALAAAAGLRLRRLART